LGGVKPLPPIKLFNLGHPEKIFFGLMRRKNEKRGERGLDLKVLCLWDGGLWDYFGGGLFRNRLCCSNYGKLIYFWMVGLMIYMVAFKV